MNARLRILVPTVFVAAGVILLSACGPDNGAAKTITPAAGGAPVAVQKLVQGLKGAAQMFGGPNDVNCGTADEAIPDTVLMAMDTAAGIVGCEEVFNVFADYTKAMDNGQVQVAELDSGWTCTEVQSAFAATDVMVFCFEGTVSSLVTDGGLKGRAFYNASADAVPGGSPTDTPEDTPEDTPTEAPGDLPSPPVADHLDNPNDVDCGSVPEMADGDRVMAMDTEWGVAGCGDAMNVLGEVYEAGINGGTSDGPF